MTRWPVGQRRREPVAEGLGVAVPRAGGTSVRWRTRLPGRISPVRVEIVGRDQHARAEREDADGAVGLLLDDAG